MNKTTWLSDADWFSQKHQEDKERKLFALTQGCSLKEANALAYRHQYAYAKTSAYKESQKKYNESPKGIAAKQVRNEKAKLKRAEVAKLKKGLTKVVKQVEVIDALILEEEYLELDALKQQDPEWIAKQQMKKEHAREQAALNRAYYAKWSDTDSE